MSLKLPPPAAPMKFGLRLDLGIGPANGSPEDDGIALSQFLKVEFGIDRSIFDQARITGEFDHACQALGQQLAVKLCQDLPRMGPAMAKFLAERLKKAFENGSRIVLPGGLT